MDYDKFAEASTMTSLSDRLNNALNVDNADSDANLQRTEKETSNQTDISDKDNDKPLDDVEIESSDVSASGCSSPSVTNVTDSTVQSCDIPVDSACDLVQDKTIKDESVDSNHLLNVSESDGTNECEKSETENQDDSNKQTNNQESDDSDADFVSEESGSDIEYESADEGEEFQTDKQNLQELEDQLTDDQKEEKRADAKALKDEGNELFRCGSYKSALRIYSRALRTCPLKFPKDRAILYSNRAACKMRMDDNEASIHDCTKAIELHPHYLKAVMRRAELYEKTDKLDEALADYQKILELDPSQHSAREACMRLPDQIKERNEKLKEEMMGKLKDLGNMILRPFGLSTNNFQMNQDPNSGGYSVNFVQNPQNNS